MIIKAKGTLLNTSGTGPLEKAVRDYYKNRATSTFKQVESKVTKKVQDKIQRYLLSSGTIQSILSGRLRSDFGLSYSDATSSVNSIIKHISENIFVSLKYSYKGANIANFILELLPLGINELSSLPEGNYISSGKYGGGDVTWLTWLLTQGTKVIIGDFYVFDGISGTSRSNESVMQKVKNGSSGFRIDPGFAGSEDDNFVTRALSPIIPEIKDEIFKTFKEALK
jgi:hypothetical protein